jgi:hypothetical protein
MYYVSRKILMIAFTIEPYNNSVKKLSNSTIHSSTSFR